MSNSAKLIQQIRAAARARRKWEQENIYYTKSEAAARHLLTIERDREQQRAAMRDA